MRHPLEEKLRIVRKLSCGYPLHRLCKELRLDRHMVKDWFLRYNHLGEAGLLKGTSGYSLTAEEKERIVSEYQKERLSLHEISLRYGVSRTTVRNWLRKVRSGISLQDTVRRGRKPYDMARPRKREPQTELERLQAENLRLRAENALLKKVRALVEEQKARAQLNGRRPSTD